MRVTEKGQVTIPKQIRDKLGIGPGSEVDFVEEGQSVKIVAANAGQFDAEAFRRTLDSLAGTVDLGGMTTDEYMLWLRGPRDDLGTDGGRDDQGGARGRWKRPPDGWAEQGSHERRRRGRPARRFRRQA